MATTPLSRAESHYLSLRRVTGDGLFVDAIALVFANASVASADQRRCMLHGCSESQGDARTDLSTNYCNIHNLYCGGVDCHPMLADMAFEELNVSSSPLAMHDVSMCVNGPSIGKLSLAAATAAIILVVCCCCMASRCCCRRKGTGKGTHVARDATVLT